MCREKSHLFFTNQNNYACTFSLLNYRYYEKNKTIELLNQDYHFNKT